MSIRRAVPRFTRRRQDLPMPPYEFRRLVGPTNDAAFDNPTGSLVYEHLPASSYDAVFDFGCGCGRIARQLIQQRPRPRRYVGIDLHREMIEWCNQNLAPAAAGFEFHHHDVFNYSSNPDRSRPDVLPFPAEDKAFSLVNAHSVFTHLTETQAEHYLREAARILRADGILHATWFLLDKREFGFMQPSQNALYVNYVDPSAAVVFDRQWLRDLAAAAGLVVVKAIPPTVRGYQWFVLMTPRRSGVEEVPFPLDTGPLAPLDFSKDRPDVTQMRQEACGPEWASGDEAP